MSATFVYEVAYGVWTGEVTSGVITNTVVTLPKLVGLLPRLSTKWFRLDLESWFFDLAILKFEVESCCGGFGTR